MIITVVIVVRTVLVGASVVSLRQFAGDCRPSLVLQENCIFTLDSRNVSHRSVGWVVSVPLNCLGILKFVLVLHRLGLVQEVVHLAIEFLRLRFQYLPNDIGSCIEW